LDYHTLSDKNHEWGPKSSPIDQERLLFSVREKSKPIEERALKCYANFHFLMTTRFSQDRKDAIKKIPANCIYYEQSKVTRLRTWITQAQYAFVISPHGNGLDCHRTWEALALGCIPIVKSSPLDPMFAGLPVWIVKDWSEVNLSAMSCKIAEYKGRQVREKMQLSYWMGVILG
jgi:hypothetical protein